MGKEIEEKGFLFNWFDGSRNMGELEEVERGIEVDGLVEEGEGT
jgi:hypothetical protein